MVALPTNPSATGTQPGTAGPPGTSLPPPPTGNCDLINAIKDLTREVREFKEAYKQVNRDRLQKVGLDRPADQSAVDAGLARLKAAQAGRTVERQLAELKQAQAGSAPPTAVAAR
jgi:Sec-independent protein translocase protein TatA